MPGRTYPDTDSSNELNGTHEGQEGPEVYPSDAPDASNLLEEIGSEDFPTYFLELDERLFPSPSSSTPYPFPVDTPEQEVGVQFYPHGVFLMEVSVFCFVTACYSLAPDSQAIYWRTLRWPRSRRLSTRDRTSKNGS